MAARTTATAATRSWRLLRAAGDAFGGVFTAQSAMPFSAIASVDLSDMRSPTPCLTTAMYSTAAPTTMLTLVNAPVQRPGLHRSRIPDRHERVFCLDMRARVADHRVAGAGWN
jgi:hypothetical protein